MKNVGDGRGRLQRVGHHIHFIMGVNDLDVIGDAIEVARRGIDFQFIENADHGVVECARGHVERARFIEGVGINVNFHGDHTSWTVTWMTA